MHQNPWITDLAAATALRVQIERFFRRRLADGLLPFEGQWLTSEGIQQQLTLRRRRAKIILWELLATFILLSGVGTALVLLTLLLAY